MLLFLALHLVFCLVVFVLLRLRVLAGTRMVFPLVCLVPVWGALALLMLELHSRRSGGQAVDPGVDRLLVRDEIYRSIPVDRETPQSQVAPINEILSINDVRVRRSVIMEVLYDDPAHYIQQLQAARVNDDTEVVHYAVTALVELQKDYDLRFQHLERKMQQEPGDPTLKQEQLALLEQYVDSGLVEGSSRTVYVQRYSALLAQELSAAESYPLYLKKIKADLELRDYPSVYRCAARMVQLWPEREAGYLRLLDYYALQKDRAGIDRVLRTLREREVYLSPKGRGAVRFWQSGAEGEP